MITKADPDALIGDKAYDAELLFIGTLKMVAAGCGVLGAVLFSRLCGRFSLRPLLAAAILIHVCAALLFLGYRTPKEVRTDPSFSANAS